MEQSISFPLKAGRKLWDVAFPWCLRGKCSTPLISTLPSRLWGEAAGEAGLPHFLFKPISFPRCLLACFCLHRHLSLAFGDKSPDPSPHLRDGGSTGSTARERGSSRPSLLLWVLFSSSCTSIFIEGKGRKTAGNPREVEHLVIIRAARLAWECTGSRESQLGVTQEGRRGRWDVKHARGKGIHARV